MQWTPELVREKLPNVTVRYAGHTYAGFVRGRRERFAWVWGVAGCTVPSFTGSTLPMPSQRTPEREVAWSTIARCLNQGRAIHLD